MKTYLWLSIAALGVIGATTLSSVAKREGTAKTEKAAPVVSKVKVGVDPGNVSKTDDVDAAAKSRGHQLATYGGGCFWGMEQTFRKIKGVVATAVGYTGGTLANPTYTDVCTHTTGHVESVLVEFDPKVISFEKLTKAYFAYIDPTLFNGQGPDMGTNYRTVVFYHSAEQAKQAEAIKKAEQKTTKEPVVVAIEPAKKFWLAEDYHQQYDEKRGVETCPSPRSMKGGIDPTQ